MIKMPPLMTPRIGGVMAASVNLEYNRVKKGLEKLNLPPNTWKQAGLRMERAAFEITTQEHPGRGASGLAGSWRSLVPSVREIGTSGRKSITLAVESELPYAAQLNYGGEIRPVKAQWLTIPISQKAKAFATARQQKDLVAIKGKKPNTLLLIQAKKKSAKTPKSAKAKTSAKSRKNTPKKSSGISQPPEVHWYLVKSVNVPKAGGSRYFDKIKVQSTKLILKHLEETVGGALANE